MLRAFRLQDFRSFADSGRIELSNLNVFVGPNSAGKTNIMTAIELALLEESAPNRPLPIAQVPSFGSFDSVVRRQKRARSPGDSAFSLAYYWDNFWGEFWFKRSPSSGSAIISRANYGNKTALPEQISLAIEATDAEATKYQTYKLPGVTTVQGGVVFEDRVPFVLKLGKKNMVHWVFSVQPYSDWWRTVIVRPHRPIPRSIYVLDDPMMNADDSRLITDLLRLWGDEAHGHQRETIVENLRTMTLAADLDVRTLGHRRGPRTAEIRVSPRKKGDAATLADVGYGVSQVLPLLSHDAQLSGGNLLVYQPEAHLHPLAQSRLADVFVASAKRKNNIYVETHSEHLVMRLQTLIAAGVVEPERVRVFCVEHDGKQSNITTMAFDERGIPKERWPKGFLDTGLDLARDLAEQRRKKAP